MEECLTRRSGGDWSKIATAKRKLGDIAAFVELHVEQGGILESTKNAIAVASPSSSI